MRVLIIGASGSGTTTLGRALAEYLDWKFIDADDYYWLPSEPPFREKRDNGLRLSLLLDAASTNDNTIISGSVMDWGSELEDSFGLIVFLTLATQTRLVRITDREIARFGRKPDAKFVDWAAQYDEGRLSGRSRERHERWLAKRTCPILRIDEEFPIADGVGQFGPQFTALVQYDASAATFASSRADNF